MRRRCLENVEGIAFTQFGIKDVVRHPVVQRVVSAYEAHEQATEHPRGAFSVNS